MPDPRGVRRRIDDAVAARYSVDEIEAGILEPEPLDEEHHDALWLYAWAVSASAEEGMEELGRELEPTPA